MAVTTVYDIKVNYKFKENQAAKKLKQLTKQTKKLSRQTKKASKGFNLLSFALRNAIPIFALKKGIDVLGSMVSSGVDFVATMEQAQIATAGLLQLNIGGSFEHNMRQGSALMAAFKEDAIASTSTMAELTDFASKITGAVSRGGGSVSDIRDITKSAVIAAKAFGIQSDVAALDIEQALLGTLKNRDRFARALLQPLGFTTEEWNKLVKKSPIEAVKTLKKAFKQEGLKAMGEAQRTSFGGVMSTFADSVQQLKGAVALPSTNSFLEGMMKINKFLKVNKRLVDSFADNLGHTFKFLGHMLSSFVVPSIKLVISTWVILADTVRSLTTDTGLTNWVFNMTSILKFAGKKVANFFLDALIGFMAFSRRMSQSMINGVVSSLNFLLKGLNKLPGIKLGAISEFKLDDKNEKLIKSLKFDTKRGPELRDFKRKDATTDPLDTAGSADKKLTAPTNLNVSISKIEVSSDDPDRFAFQLVSAFEDIAKKPTQASAALAEI